MTIPTEPVAVELERIRGIVEAGFARLEGSLALVVQRSDRAEQDIRQIRADLEKELGAMKAEFDDALAGVRADVEELKRGRWPIPAIGGLVGVGGLAAAIWQGISH